MSTSVPHVVRLTVFAALIFPVAIISAQIPAGSSARSIPTEVEKSDVRVTQIIAGAEDHFRKGKLNLEDNKRDQARDEFDKAVDTILESGLDVRASQRLQTFYLELVERIYREEVPLGHGSPQVSSVVLVAQTVQSPAATPGQTPKEQTNQPQVGFRDQKFEPSPLDELSKLVLTLEERNVSDAEVEDLEQAKNNVNFSFKTNPLIQQFINYYQGRGRTTMESGLRRSGRFMKLAREIFKNEGVPVDITWLAQVESAWRPTAVSWAAASGLWQFVPSSGSAYGLRQTAWIDERNSFEQATHASARYLKNLAARYDGNWELAMAAYNTGALNVDRAIARVGTADFWAIYPYIAQETRNYVPNILATILIAKNPDKYGFYGIRPDPPLSYDVVQVPTATSLHLIADATDTNLDYIRSINPELRRDITPHGATYNVRIPAGKAKQFVAVLKRIPGDRRETARVISVAPGEDLQTVASRTGVSVAQLQALNSGVDLKLATRLVVPNSNVRLTSWKRATPAATGSDETAGGVGLTKIRARNGDTIAKIASARKLDAVELAHLNGLAVDAELKAGQEIKLPPSASVTTAPSRRRGR